MKMRIQQMLQNRLDFSAQEAMWSLRIAVTAMILHALGLLYIFGFSNPVATQLVFSMLYEPINLPFTVSRWFDILIWPPLVIGIVWPLKAIEENELVNPPGVSFMAGLLYAFATGDGSIGASFILACLALSFSMNQNFISLFISMFWLLLTSNILYGVGYGITFVLLTIPIFMLCIAGGFMMERNGDGGQFKRLGCDSILCGLRPDQH